MCGVITVTITRDEEHEDDMLGLGVLGISTSGVFPCQRSVSLDHEKKAAIS